jgi:hypothetical protein
MSIDQINLRYKIYAKLHNKTIDEMMVFDQERYLGGSMIGFILFIDEMRRKYKKCAGIHHEEPIKDQDEFTWFINKQVERNQTEGT